MRGGSIGCDRGVACIILVYQHGFSKLRGRSGRYSSRQHDDLTFLSPQLWHLLRNVEAIPRYFYRTVHQTSDKEEFNANGECVWYCLNWWHDMEKCLPMVCKVDFVSFCSTVPIIVVMMEDVLHKVNIEPFGAITLVP